jgi:DDE superfamily endonuclease
VLSVDEKSQIQALDRTQPGLPLKKGRAGTMTHDYKRNGTTTLFAAMNVLDGTAIGRNMQRHRHQEFIGFLNAVEREVPAGKTIHAIIDNYAAHKHPTVRRWLARYPRWTFTSLRLRPHGSTPSRASSPSSPNAVSRRGVFRSVADLQAAINRFLDDHNAHSKPSNGSTIPTKSSPPSGAGIKG